MEIITDGNRNYSLLDYKKDLVASTMDSMLTNFKLDADQVESIIPMVTLGEYMTFDGVSIKSLSNNLITIKLKNKY